MVSLAGATLLARQSIDEQRALFETDARIVHRLLSQQVVQHDAILDTLALLQPGPDGASATPPEQRLPALYPHILSVQRRDRGAAWPDAALADAETRSRQSRRPALAGLDLASGRYRLVLAAEPAAYALTIDLQGMVPWGEWPMPRATSAVQVRLEHGGQSFELQPGNAAELSAGSGWRFEFHKHLAASSQPFDVVARQQLGWSHLPWGLMLGWVAAVAGVLALLAQWQRQRTARRRAEELLRLGQVARLNTLGELAAGMAHELNQPLTAVLANTQAAQRLLADDPPELDTARGAMAQAVAQARRAADVVGRLRTAVERPAHRADAAANEGVVDLAEAVRRALHLLEPECQRRGVAADAGGLRGRACARGPGGRRPDRAQPADERAAGHGRRRCIATRVDPVGRHCRRPGRVGRRRPRPRHRARSAAAPVRTLLLHPRRRSGPGPAAV